MDFSCCGSTRFRKTREALIKSARADGERFAAQPQTIYSEFPKNSLASVSAVVPFRYTTFRS